MQQFIVCVRDLISVLSYAEFESLSLPAGQRLASAKLWTVFGWSFAYGLYIAVGAR